MKGTGIGVPRTHTKGVGSCDEPDLDSVLVYLDLSCLMLNPEKHSICVPSVYSVSYLSIY